nr:hypothetical protein CFP56_78404 [Quercus suber]
MCHHKCDSGYGSSSYSDSNYDGRQPVHTRTPSHASIMEILILKGWEKYQASKAAKAALRAARRAEGFSDSDSMASSRMSTSRPSRLSDASSLEKSMLGDADVEKTSLPAPPAYQPRIPDILGARKGEIVGSLADLPVNQAP